MKCTGQVALAPDSLRRSHMAQSEYTCTVRRVHAESIKDLLGIGVRISDVQPPLAQSSSS